MFKELFEASTMYVGILKGGKNPNDYDENIEMKELDLNKIDLTKRDKDIIYQINDELGIELEAKDYTKKLVRALKSNKLEVHGIDNKGLGVQGVGPNKADLEYELIEMYSQD